MNTAWAIVLAREDSASLAALRLARGIEVAETDTLLWLRGKGSDEVIINRLATLPARERYEWQPPSQLRLIGQRIPAHRLPELRWQPLENWLHVSVPLAALPAELPRPTSLRLVRSSLEQKPELLLTSLEELRHFAATAAQVRLACLHYAVNSTGGALVRGNPLPPLPGQQFVIHGYIAVPAGYAWQPAVAAEVVARRLGISGEALAIWHEDGTLTRLLGEQFLPLTRSGVRATGNAFATPS